MSWLLLCGDPGIAPDGTKGAAVHLRSIAASLQRSGLEVALCTRRAPEDRGALPVPWRPWRDDDDLDRAVAELGVPELIYERYALGECGGRELARRSGCPWVLEVNAPLAWETERYRPTRARAGDTELENELFRSADLVCAVSEPLRAHVAVRRGGLEGTAVLRNGFDAEHYAATTEVRAAVDRAIGRELVIAFLGHPKPWHGAERLPGLLAAARRAGHRARLLLIGGGAGADAVVERARELGVEDALEVTGALPAAEAARRLCAADLLVAPYPRHAFFYFCPLKVIEGLAAGLPVLSTDQGDLRAITADAAVLVDPADDAALERELLALLAEPERRRTLGAKARARAWSHFTWDRTAAELRRLVARAVLA